MLSHILSKCTKADTGEEVDGESRVLWVVLGEEPLEERACGWVIEKPLLHPIEADVLEDLLEHDLDEDTGGGGGVLLCHPDDVHDGPGDSVARDEVAEEAGDVAEPIRLVPMDGVVVRAEAVFKVDRPHRVELGQSLAHEAVEFVVAPLLRATLNHHVAQLALVPLWHLHLEQLVHRLLKVERGHDGDVDRSAQIDQVGLGLVVDVEGTVGGDASVDIVFILVLVALLTSATALLAVTVAEDLPLDLLVLVLVLGEFWVHLEHVEAVLYDEVVVQTETVGDEVVLLDQVESLGDDGVVLELLSSDLEEDFDHVLHPLLDSALVQDRSE